MEGMPNVPGWIASNIFFLGFSCAKGSLPDESTARVQTTREPVSKVTPSNSAPSKYTRSPGILDFSGTSHTSIPPSLPSLDVACECHGVLDPSSVAVGEKAILRITPSRTT